mmetsp:Transcript_7753/g.25782  ORF Transcript_7753/g.25782 Transcript_7753/m.25782 type:complete len:205 (-) Transcript_7753:63-677(-)
MTHFLKRSVRSLTTTVSGPENLAQPWYTCAPAAAEPSCESAGAMWARSRRIRAITASKSTSSLGAVPSAATRNPSASAALASRAARAQWSSALDGTQPTLRQSPPARWPEMSAERASRRAACLADTSPPAPAPMTTRSYTSGGDGSVQRRGWTASSSLALLASSGSISSCRAALASASALGSQRATAETGGVRMPVAAAEGGER